MIRNPVFALAASWAGLTLAATSPALHAQTPNDTKPAPVRAEPEPTEVQTFFLKNVTHTNGLNDIQTDLRNVLPRAKIYGVSTQNAITVRTDAEGLKEAAKLIGELDRASRNYRITYTVAQTEGGKRMGTQRFSLTVAEDNTADLKQGNRVPIMTGRYAVDKPESADTQFQYLDVGINIRCTIGRSAVQSKIELSSIADEKSSVGIQDPIIHQTFLENSSPFTPGKPQVIGTIDVPGTNQHEEIEMLVEPIQ